MKSFTVRKVGKGEYVIDKNVKSPEMSLSEKIDAIGKHIPDVGFERMQQRIDSLKKYHTPETFEESNQPRADDGRFGSGSRVRSHVKFKPKKGERPDKNKNYWRLLDDGTPYPIKDGDDEEERKKEVKDKLAKTPDSKYFLEMAYSLYQNKEKKRLARLEARREQNASKPKGNAGVKGSHYGIEKFSITKGVPEVKVKRIKAVLDRLPPDDLKVAQSMKISSTSRYITSGGQTDYRYKPNSSNVEIVALLHNSTYP